MKLLQVFVSAFLIFGFAGAQDIHAQVKGYDLSAPFKALTLPDTLREVSGITVLDKNRVACVQDENGIIFVINLLSGKLEKQYTFAANGDYEGIARVGDTLYVLRSDGVLFRTLEGKKTRVISTNIPATDNEGLCYDKTEHRLLIACKSKSGKGPEYKNKRHIYAFYLKGDTTLTRPVIELDIPSIRQFLQEKHITLFHIKEKKNGTREEVLRFMPSAIAIHPATHQLYLISSTDHMLFVFDREGNILEAARLDPQVFNKPEGLIFLENGDMLITNEGQHKKPSLLWFKKAN